LPSTPCHILRRGLFFEKRTQRLKSLQTRFNLACRDFFFKGGWSFSCRSAFYFPVHCDSNVCVVPGTDPVKRSVVELSSATRNGALKSGGALNVTIVSLELNDHVPVYDGSKSAPNALMAAMAAGDGVMVIEPDEVNFITMPGYAASPGPRLPVVNLSNVQPPARVSSSVLVWVGVVEPPPQALIPAISATIAKRMAAR
jgi:hypothetical protein